MSKTDKKNTGPAVVVELGNEWLKIVQTEPSKTGVSVSKMHLAPIDDAGMLSTSLATVYKKQKFAKQPVIGCLPRQLVNVRILDLPSTDEDEITDMVDFQAGKQTPYSKDEIVFDYRISPSGREGYSKVILAIVQRSVLSQKFSILEEAGLEVERMSISTEGVYGAYCHVGTPAGKGATVVIDVESGYSDFTVVVGASLVHSRSIMIGADKLLSEPDQWNEKYAKEVKHSMEVYQGESPDSEVEEIYVSGAGLNVDGLVEYLASQLSVQVKPLNYLKAASKMPKAPSLKDDKFSDVSIMPLIGMALTKDTLEFNLVPESVRLRKELIAKAKNMTMFGVLIMAVLVSYSVLTTLRFYYKQTRLVAISKQVQESESATIKAKEMRDVLSAVTNWKDSDVSAVNIMGLIHPLVPENVFFTIVSYDVDTGILMLKGTAESRSQINALVTELRRVEQFKTAKSIGSGDKDSRTRRYNFQIQCALEK